MELITRTAFLFLISCIAITLQNAHDNYNYEATQPAADNYRQPNYIREKRAFLKKKVGPIRQIFGLVFEQWNDTKYTLNTINNLINENIVPDNLSTTTTTPSPNMNVSTKPPPFRITRSEFARILRRNWKGLMRLQNLELNDALKQSRITEKEFKRNVTKEVARFL